MMSIEDGEIGVILDKACANITDLEVGSHPNWIQPRIGDHVLILSWDNQSHVQECIRLSKLPYLVIKEINPIIVGIGNDKYCWAYEIFVEESYLSFYQWNYKVL